MSDDVGRVQHEIQRILDWMERNDDERPVAQVLSFAWLAAIRAAAFAESGFRDLRPHVLDAALAALTDHPGGTRWHTR